MSGLTLKLRAPLEVRVEITKLTSGGSPPADAAEAARIEVPVGTRRVCLGDIFAVEDTGGERMVIEGDPRLDGVGAAMSSGEIVVEGDCGAALGAGLSGGRIALNGSCGAMLGAEMSGGRIEVTGSAGDRAGASLAGQKRGMRGGTIVIAGDAGERAAERMRAGVLIVGGSVGPGAASRMIAGTLAVAGRFAEDCAIGMKRGTILCGAAPAGLSPGFADAGEHDLVFLGFLTRSVPDLAAFIGERGSRRVRRLVGDLNADGQGEVLVLAR